ncbi:hypothetical protein C8A00DRAFT_33818 [Chaetomidium leptoderma]|uniref:Uncharacterized protein n=1 Tax=Chaetomidium leptoderma TaxID=669021 RepID=A0AAN6ZYE2_9PEZI|nr:hypothetical protein C8A00DRAFT_33818 [Chaetomidium leptoderma]
MARVSYNTHPSNPNSGNKPVQTADSNKQVQRFVLLIHILYTANLTGDEVKVCLKQALPNDWHPTMEGIAQLGRDGNVTVPVMTEALHKAKLSFIAHPTESGHSERRWLRQLLHRLARDATAATATATATASQQQGGQATADKAWSSSPDSAMWLAILARARIVLTEDEWSGKLFASIRDAYRDGWLAVFGIRRKPTEAVVSVSASPAAKKMTWSAVVRANVPGLETNKFTTAAVGTVRFFSLQAHHPAYRSLVKELPALAAKRAYQLRSQWGWMRKLEDNKPRGAGTHVSATTDKPGNAKVFIPTMEVTVEEGWTAVPGRNASKGGNA